MKHKTGTSLFSLSPGDALHRAWQSEAMSKYTAQIQADGKAAGTPQHPSPGKGRGTVPAQLTAVSWQAKAMG